VDAYAPDVDAAFYFDLASPLAYIAAERVLHELPGPLEWQPVLARELPATESFTAFRCETEAEVFRRELERRARAHGLQPLCWPEPFPFESELAMLAATYAKSIGRVVPFAQAAFRQAFAGGRSLADLDSVLIAAAACEMHPRAVAHGVQSRPVRELLARTTARAAQAGVVELPAVRYGERVFAGERVLEEARGFRQQTPAQAVDDEPTRRSGVRTPTRDAAATHAGTAATSE
jgi:2-hydroxychromene-2-carboxylate isomerase